MFRLLKKVILLLFFRTRQANVIKNISGNFEFLK